MDTGRYDEPLRALTSLPSRRGMARALSGLTLSLPLLALTPPADAKKGHKPARRDKQAHTVKKKGWIVSVYCNAGGSATGVTSYVTCMS
jgi:hypothetical protein